MGYRNTYHVLYPIRAVARTFVLKDIMGAVFTNALFVLRRVTPVVGMICGSWYPMRPKTVGKLDVGRERVHV